LFTSQHWEQRCVIWITVTYIFKYWISWVSLLNRTSIVSIMFDDKGTSSEGGKILQPPTLKSSRSIIFQHFDGKLMFSSLFTILFLKIHHSLFLTFTTALFIVPSQKLLVIHNSLFTFNPRKEHAKSKGN